MRKTISLLLILLFVLTVTNKNSLCAENLDKLKDEALKGDVKAQRNLSTILRQ
jgi:hypothetical protein